MFGIADVYTVFFLVLGILIAFPGMVSLVVFGLPKLANRSKIRVEQTPITCFLLGLPIVGVGGLIAAGLMGTGGPVAAIGVAVAVIAKEVTAGSTISSNEICLSRNGVVRL